MVNPRTKRKSSQIVFILSSLFISVLFFNFTGLHSVAAAPDTEYEFVFFDDDWRTWWGEINYGTTGVYDQVDPDPAQSDNTKSSAFSALWGKIEIRTFEPHQYPDTSTFDSLDLELWGWSDTNNGQRLAIALGKGGTFGPEVNIGAPVPAGSWMQVSIPMSQLSVPGGTFDTIVIMPEQQSGTDYDANTNGKYFAFDNVRLVKNDTSSALSCASGELGGTVFFDGDSNGAWDRREQGYAGITVTAYGASGAMIGTPQTTDADGHYKFNIADGTDVRVEFTGLPKGIRPGAVGADSEGSVIFTTANGNCNVDFGIQAPSNYCETNPELATNCYVSGDPLASGSTAANMDVLVSFDYSNEGQPAMAGGSAPNPNHIAYANQMGSTWGLAHQAETDTLFAAAMLKRHVGIGPAGLAGIYMIESDNTVTEYIDLADFGISAGSDPRDGSVGNEPLPGLRTDPSHDVMAYSQIGKIGLGDLDIDSDDTLWVVNLNDASLYGIANAGPDSTPTADDIIGGFPITAAGTNCTNGTLRPWAVKAHYDGLVYVGAVCSAENGGSEANLTAHILSFDPANSGAGFTNIFNFSLDNKGGCVYKNIADSCGWNAWDSAYGTDAATGFIYNPQPVFSDIEFDVDGSMILGFFDRAGHQFGVNNYVPDASNTTDLWYGISGGDLIRVCNDNGNFVLENNGSCPGGEGTLGKDNGEGYGGGEYYQAHFGQHQEVSQGGVALLYGTDEVAFTSMDPVSYNTSGVRWQSNTIGTTNRGYEVAPSPDDVPGMLGKAAGLGDLELICEAAPMEIGNRLWCDGNGNGKQDVGENSVGGGVNVVLTCNDDNPVTVTTAANGTYSFTDAIYQAANGTEIPRDSACYITIDTSGSNGTLLSNACGSTSVTTPNNGGGSGLDPEGDDKRDSDAIQLSNNLVGISVTTGGSGDNTHSLDFGFGASSPATLDFGDLPDSSLSAETNFPTTLADDGPRHLVSDDLYLGSCVDAETDGMPDLEAGVDVLGGDDQMAGTAQGTCEEFDDEDGVELVTPLIPGAEACVSVTATSATGTAFLNGWFDFNGDGDFVGDANEKVTFTKVNGAAVSTQDAVIANGTTTSEYCFTVPEDATFDGGETHMRFRASTTGGLNYAGYAADGEVEDYYTPLACVGNYVWQDSNTDNNVQDASDPGLSGVPVRLIWAGEDDNISSSASSTSAQGDDRFYTVTTDSSGKYHFCGLIPDAEDTYRIDIPTAPSSFPQAVAPNVGQGSAEDVPTDSDGTQSASGQPVTGPTFTIDNPIDLVTGEDGQKDTPGTINNTPDDRDDLQFDFGFTESAAATMDFGDLPDSSVSADTNFATELSDNGPRHPISNDLYLGNCVDAEFDGAPDFNAGIDNIGGDDEATGPTFGSCNDADDEDGVELVTPLIPGAEACVSVTATSATGIARLNGWFDFNGDGDFVGDANEKLTFTKANGAAVSTQDAVIANGTTTAEYCFTVPESATFHGGETHMRFRLSSAGGLSFNGAADDGEVEDYYSPLACVGNLVWQDTATNNNVQDSADTGIADVMMRLIWAGPDDTITTLASSTTAQGDDRIYTVKTDADGIYSFCGLISDAPNTYRIDVPVVPPSFTIAVTPNVGQNGATDVTTDSDGIQPSPSQPVTGPTFTINDPISLYQNENGDKDNPGVINGTPDDRDDLRFDFGFTAEGTAVGLGASSVNTTASPMNLVAIMAVTLVCISFIAIRRRA